MRNFRGLTFLVAGLALVCGTGAAQRSKYTSPAARASVVITGKKLGVDYYAPSMHGRKVMGGLVPYGEVWCTGANIATGFSTEADLRIGDMKSYLTEPTASGRCPAKREWTLIINKESGQFHLNYNSSLDFGRTKMNLRTLQEHRLWRRFRVDWCGTTAGTKEHSP